MNLLFRLYCREGFCHSIRLNYSVYAVTATKNFSVLISSDFAMFTKCTAALMKFANDKRLFALLLVFCYLS